MKKGIFIFLMSVLTIKTFGQVALKTLTFKNKAAVIKLVHFDKTLSKKQIEAFAKKNGYKSGDTTDLKFLLTKQKQLPIHCRVFIFLKEKVKDGKYWKNPEGLILCSYLETNGTAIGIREKEMFYDSTIYNNHYEEESETPVDYYICFKK